MGGRGNPAAQFVSEGEIAVASIVALVLIYDAAIRTQRDLSFLTPERPIIATLNCRVPFGGNEHSLPAKARTAIFIHSGERR